MKDNNIYVPHFFFVFKDLVDRFSCVAHVEDIANHQNDHIDLEVDECRFFKIVRNFIGPFSPQETAVNTPA